MTHLARALRSRRATTRTRRALSAAIADAPSPGVRADLVAASIRAQLAVNGR